MNPSAVRNRIDGYDTPTSLASYVAAPQNGAPEDTEERTEIGFAHYSKSLRNNLRKEVTELTMATQDYFGNQWENSNPLNDVRMWSAKDKHSFDQATKGNLLLSGEEGAGAMQAG